MNWKPKALTIWSLAVPALSGFPINRIPAVLLPGVDWGWLVYGVLVHAVIFLLLGRKIWKISIIIALAIAIPLVVLGSLISMISLLVSGWSATGLADIVYHYISLAATMVVVIPLALSMVAVLPLHRVESRILQSSSGVSFGKKVALMFLRVFSHIFFFVIPNILEIIREEGLFPGRHGLGGKKDMSGEPLHNKLRTLIRTLVNIGVESICSAVRFIPLWADEISMLPNKRKAGKIDKVSQSSED